jgi:2-oxoisovalerate dehydrogenase E2 component (dihydrolipoyl transacylase)
MTQYFNLPDLGEGLAEAEIHEWYVKEGDKVSVDQLLVSMETAKAVVDVPSPVTGTIAKLYGKAGDVILTGAHLVEFITDSPDAVPPSHKDAATVAGALEVSDRVIQEPAAGIIPRTSTANSLKVLPAVRMLAKQLNVDLATVSPSGPHGQISADDVKSAAQRSASVTSTSPLTNAIPLRGVEKAMAVGMAHAHAEVVPVTLVDDADIDEWVVNTDITARVLRAVVVACRAEPSLNAHFDGKNLARELKTDVNIGLAMDSAAGLFVPVIKNAEARNGTDLREIINRYKQEVSTRTIPQADLHGATITLSNFGTIAGRYANPIVMPPCVAIIGTGRIRDEVVAVNGHAVIHRILPLSLTFDHRAATGGEASRFLGALIQDLQKAE